MHSVRELVIPWQRRVSAPRPRSRRVPKAVAAMVLLGTAVTLSTCATPPAAEQLVTISGPTMGTRYSIKAIRLPEGISHASLKHEVDALLRRINQQMSTYIDDSEVSRFNRAVAGEWFEVSYATARVVLSARDHSQKTGGTFDATVCPLVDLWSFGPQRERRSLPSHEQIAAVQTRVGFEKLQVRLDPPALKKSVDGLQVDLSAIAKGYAVDAVAELLSNHQINDYLVEIGGEVRVKGARPEGRGWRIGIESPQIEKREIARIVELENIAMATSGDYRNYLEVDGKRYSHTIDPRTGRPVEHQLASVTVLAGDCMTADALATALLVMGPEKGLAWADKHGEAVLFITRTTSGFTQRPSRTFDSLSNSL